MMILNNISDMRKIVDQWKKQGLTVGLVPTMGFLHEGHESLIKRAAAENDRVVVSIFVNPIQFGKNEDFSVYPRNIERDSSICQRAGAHAVFNPAADEMYLDGFSTYIDVGDISKELCGKSRPIHFRGVCTVVAKLFNIVKPDRAYFGQKDAQQAAIIHKLIKDLKMDVELVVCPIVRESDGLAKSSRNVYLNPEERKAAPVLHRALCAGESLISSGQKDAEAVKKAIADVINTEPLAKIDYVDVVAFPEIKPVNGDISGKTLVATAVFIGKTRLIDNFIVG